MLRGDGHVWLMPALALTTLTTACDTGEVRLLAPETSSDEPATRLQVTLDTPFVSLATSLGWSQGIPGATVRFHRTEEPYDNGYWVSVTTDESGGAGMPNLLTGLYDVEVVRQLTPEERAAVGNQTYVVAGGRVAWLPADEFPLTAQPNRRGTLVFSEVAITGPPPWETGGGNYDDAKYLEIYNNSTQTIFLDGMLLGIGYDYSRDSSFRPCGVSETVLNDPGGIWTNQILRFPGNGAQFPVEPGGLNVVAKSAVDHRPAHATLQDLSGADFEWGGERTADNPDVPNLADVGPTPVWLNKPIGEDPIFLARPVDLNGLPTWVQPYDGYRYVRIPSAAVLDAVAPLYDFTRASFEPTQRCLHVLNAAFERLPGPALWEGETGALYSLQRRVLADSPTGTPLLQDTNTSMADFVRAMVTPGTIMQVPPGG